MVTATRPEWEPVKMLPQQAVFRHKQDSMIADIGNLSMSVQYTEKVRPADAGPAVERLALAAEYYYELVVGLIQSTRTERIGVGVSFTFPAGSVEEADRFVARSLESPFASLLARAFRWHSDRRSRSLFRRQPDECQPEVFCTQLRRPKSKTRCPAARRVSGGRRRGMGRLGNRQLHSSRSRTPPQGENVCARAIFGEQTDCARSHANPCPSITGVPRA